MSDGVKIFDLAVAFLLSCRHSSSTKKSPMRSSMFISTYFLHTTNSKLVGTTYNEISCLVNVSFFFSSLFLSRISECNHVSRSTCLFIERKQKVKVLQQQSGCVIDCISTFK
jgi:hypothetical protein